MYIDSTRHFSFVFNYICKFQMYCMGQSNESISKQQFAWLMLQRTEEFNLELRTDDGEEESYESTQGKYRRRLFPHFISLFHHLRVNKCLTSTESGPATMSLSRLFQLCLRHPACLSPNSYSLHCAPGCQSQISSHKLRLHTNKKAHRCLRAFGHCN